MTRFTSALLVAALAIISAAPKASAHQTFEQCIQDAGDQYAKDKANGVDPTSAAAWWQEAIAQCKRQYHR